MQAFDFSFFTWEIFRDYILDGLYFSVMLTIVATIGGILWGTVLALMRLSGNKWLDLPAAAYVNGMRSVPLLMVLLWFYLLLPAEVYAFFGIDSAQRPQYAAMITFIMFEGAYFSEIVRAGIQSISRGQIFAGQALGMTYGQNMRLVILPQAFRNMLPVFLTQTIILFQDTSLVYIITAHDFLHGFTTVGSNFSAKKEAYILAAIAYFIICYGLSLIVKRVNQKIAIIR
jgi:glutamate/aspartate transport system permease protein